jgi:flagellar hook-length control protein FliK
VSELASQLAARVGQPADERGHRDHESARDDRRKMPPPGFDVTERDRPAPASAAPAMASMSHSQGDATEAHAETTNQHLSAAPAFAAHVALESPTAGPRLMAAPGFAARLEAAPAVMDRELPGQIVQAIRLQFAEGGGDAVVRLQPHFLGEVVVSIRVDQGLVTASLQSDTPAVRQWIEAHEGTLRAALVDQGLQLERLTVSDSAATDDGEETARRRNGEREPQEERQRRPRKDGDGTQTFEVFV